MKVIKSKVLFDGAEEKENLLIGFEGDDESMLAALNGVR
jgi:hypothetical protein